MSDQFQWHADSVSAPSRLVVTLDPSDDVDLSDTPKGIYVGVGGDVTLVAIDAPVGAGVTFRNLPSGSLLPVRARRVLATGTTAADLLALL